MRTTDNNGGKSFVDFVNLNIDDLSCIANRSLIDLQKDNPDLLVFPQSLGEYRDDVEKSHVFSLEDEKITTYNLMGFVGRNSTQLSISSRFAKDDHNDYFLHYMLQKVFSINILKFDQTPNAENIWDFLLYLFPYFLKKAYSQGLYKAYKRVQYNDANVKGTIDVKKHIIKNIPFTGKIVYTTREHSYNNDLTQLVRHTIEHIKIHPFANGILVNDSEVREIISKFNFVTQNSYNKNSRQKIISANLKPVSHPYFTEYKMLQKICLKILRRDKLTFGKDKDKIYGLLFDGAWLWEEYLNTILKKHNFIHPENKTGKKAIFLFESGKGRRFPDFWKEGIILDAKYKRLAGKNGETMDRNDTHQIISYMYIKQSKLSGFICPSDESSDKNTTCSSLGILNGYGGEIKLWTISIPQDADNYADFCKQMQLNEVLFENNLITEALPLAIHSPSLKP